jgi:hypothetical protein
VLRLKYERRYSPFLDHQKGDEMPEIGTPQRIIVPNVLRYQRSSGALFWGIALLVGGQVAMGACVAFVTINDISSGNGTITTSSPGFAPVLLFAGVVASIIGLVSLLVGLTNLSTNVDLIAWVTQEQLKAESAASRSAGS